MRRYLRCLVQSSPARRYISRSFTSSVVPREFPSAAGRLSGDVAVITGGGAGIGRETALLFASAGAKVVVADVNESAINEVVKRIRADGGSAVAVRTDVSKSAEVERLIQTGEREFGKVSVIFNNAGIMHADDDNAETTTEAIWDLTFAVNVKSVLFGCKFGIPALRRAGGGSIINTASFVALLGAATPQLAYTASKGAVLAMSRELAVIHARENIRVNALCPGPLRTKLLMDFLIPKRRSSGGWCTCRWAASVRRQRWRARVVPREQRVVVYYGRRLPR